MITWGYAINQWKSAHDLFVRLEEHERAFKTISVCGFAEVELYHAFGRWEPLGSPEWIGEFYGSVPALLSAMRACGLERAASIFYDPGRPAPDRLEPGHSAAERDDHAAIELAARQVAAMLSELGGSTLVARPIGSYWRQGAPDSETLKTVAACWDRVGAATRELGVSTVLHVDCLSAIHTEELLEELLALCDPALVGLALDTAELTIAGIDPVALYERQHARVRHFHFKDVRETDTLGERLAPQADVEFLTGGGSRGIERWFYEMGSSGGLVDFPALMEAMRRHGYAGSVIVESDQSPEPATSAMLNGWYVRNVLA